MRAYILFFTPLLALLLNLHVTGCESAVTLCEAQPFHWSCHLEGGIPNGGNDGAVSTEGAVPDGSIEGCDPLCSAPSPVCDPTSNRCVECLESVDCERGTCTEQRCIVCATSTECPVGTSCRDGTCVACVDNNDCTDPASARCSERGECIACVDDTDCDGFAGRPVCGASGQCIAACTVDDPSACGDRPCNPVTGACSAYDTGSADTCEPCDSDANCTEMNAACIELRFGGESQGGYCLPASVAPGVCASRPFSVTITATSLSGAMAAEYCGIDTSLTTCEAVRAAVSGTECPGGAADCASEGASCQTIGVPNQCTYLCATSQECPSGLGCVLSDDGTRFCG